MKLIDNVLYASGGALLRRVGSNELLGDSVSLGYRYYDDAGNLLDPPVLDTVADFEEVTEEDLKREMLPEYSLKVESFIREHYSLSDELAIQRQRDTKPEQFQEYFRYCEDCKIRAKQELGLLEPIEDEQQSI